MGEIIPLSKIDKYVAPNTATLVGGSFDLFNVSYLRFLKDCSDCGRPLVVIIQSDSSVRIRKGFNRPVVGQKHRAEIVAALCFVDYVIVLPKPPHHKKYLAKIKPKIYPKMVRS